jgi:adenylate cyclase
VGATMSPEESSRTILLGDWALDVGSQRLRRDRVSHVLRPKEVGVLLQLASAAPDLVAAEVLLERVWPGVVVVDHAVHEVISRLRKVLGDNARHPRYIETLHRRGYRLVCSVEHPRDHQGTVQTATPGSASAERAGLLLAVLPFEDLSPDGDMRYFSDGVSEEILTTVARTTGVRVVGRMSSFQFRGSNKVVPTVAAELGCTHVLDGSVRRSGERLRVTAQLIDCARETTVWTGRVERSLADVFALQDEIARAVSRAFEIAFAGPNEADPVDPIAYDLYLKAKSSLTQWLGAYDAELLEQTIARAPAFAEAWAALAITRAIEFHVERRPATLMKARTRAIEAANAALSLDPAIGAAYAALSIVEPVCGRYIERDELIAHALRVSPNDPVVLFWASRWSWTVGRLREMLGYATRAYRIEPLWAQGVHEYASALWVGGFEAEADRVWDDAINRWPDLEYLFNAQLSNSANDGRWDRFDQVRAEAERAGVCTPGYQGLLRRSSRMRNWTSQDTATMRSQLMKKFEQTGSLSLHQHFLCQKGLTDFVYDLFQRASFDHLFEPDGRLREGDFGLHHLFSFDDAMRRDRRFVQLCGWLGLCSYWVKTGRWPDCADELAGYYDFRAEARRYTGPL